MRVLNHKTEAVVVGVLDKNPRAMTDWQEVTYVDDLGVVHTVFAHKSGPFGSPEEIVQAHKEGRLHTEDHEIDEHGDPVAPAGPVFE